MGTAPSGHAGKRLNLIAAEAGSVARKDKARSAKRSEFRFMVRSVAQFVCGSQAPIKPLRRRPLMQIKARLRRTFNSTEITSLR
jgi:hypothetical protein